jgi:hypothetical protein
MATKDTNGVGARSLSRAAMYLPAAALVPALVAGTASLFGRGPRWLRERRRTAALLTAGAAAALVRWQLGHLFVEEPDYELERKVGGLEIRRYRPHAIAETLVEAASWEDAIDEGFRRLAGYIFGRPAHERIAMTAPVTSHQSTAGYVVTFSMPKTRPLESLPQSKDPRVRLRQAPERRVAVLRYRGTYRRRRTEERQAALLAQVRAAGLEPTSAPEFAGYDAPSTIPLVRRVEAWVSIA